MFNRQKKQQPKELEYELANDWSVLFLESEQRAKDRQENNEENLNNFFYYRR